jgi:hypothetical protein
MKASGKLIGEFLCMAVVAFAARQASAANLIQNPGVETGTLIDWTVTGSGFGVGVSVRPYGSGPSAPGTYLAFMSNLVGSTTLSLQQSTPTASAVPGLVNYSFDLWNILSANGGTFSIQISDLNSSGGVIDQGPGLLQPNVPIDGNWHTISGLFTAPATVDHLEIQFNCTDTEVLLVDNVSLSQVPEPTSLTLVAMGLLGAFLGLRKRRKL